MLDTVLQAALADPLKTLLGSGGIVGLLVLVVKWWSGRVRLRARFISETYDVRAEVTVPTQIHIEVENLGQEATSILPDVSLTYLYPHKTRASAELKVVSAERTLQPVTPRTITLKGDLPAGYLFSHFRVLRVRFSRGPALSVRVLNASGKSAGFVRFSWLRFLFIAFGALPHVEG